MNTENQIPEEELQRIGAAYASVCLERPAFLYRFTGWSGESAVRLAAARRRLLEEFDAGLETTLDDLVGAELAECYLSYDCGRLDEAVERLERAAAVLLRGIRMLKIEKLDKTEDSNG